MTSYQDTLNRMVKQEDTPRIELVVSVLRPLLMFLFQWHLNCPEMEARLKHIDNEVEKINRDFKPPKCVSNSHHVQLVPFNLNILQSLKEDINEIVSLHNCRSVSSLVTWEKAEHVVSFINSLSQILKDISISEGEAQPTIFVVNPMKKEIVQLEERLMFLINFFWLTTNPLFEFGNKKVVLNSAQRLAVEILHKLFLCFLGDDELVADHTREDILPYLLRKIDTLLLEIMHLYRGSDSIRLPDGNRTMNEHILGFVDHLIHKLKLLSRSNNEASFVVTVKVQMEILVDELNFLRHSLMDLLLQIPDVKMTISTLALIVETGFFVYLSLHKQEGGELTDKYSSSGLPDLLEAVHTIRQQASDLFSSRFPWLLQSNYLSTNKLKFVNSMIEELEDLMCSKAARIIPLKHQIEMINKEMLTLRKYFGEISKLENTQMELLFTRFVDAANLAKYVTDSFLAGEDSLWFQKLGLYVITKDMRNMQKEIKSLLELTCPTPTNVQNVAVASSLASSQANYPPNIKAAEMQNKVQEANKLVGLKDEIDKIIEQLTGGSRQLQVLSIVGMPGLGKTTLANSVYKHPSVSVNFHVRAWCYLSQVHEKETVLFTILGQTFQETNRSHEISREDIVQKLYQSLKGRRYLIVLDDVWDIEAWNGLKEIFPDDENGSRILFTTRNHSVALEANSLPYALRLLSTEESYELLSKKLFNGDTCPNELSVISRLIASSCKGLPLAVVLIAGTLKKTEQKKKSWEQVAKTLIRSHSIQEQIFDILAVSYKYLPDHLKPCFCYFGTFPGGKIISVSKIIQLWISERFVQLPNTGKMNLKQEAESYLNDLIDRSLVMISRKSSTGGVKACHVHDVLREFCASKLEKRRSMIREDVPGGIAVLYGGFKWHKLNLLHHFLTTKVPHICSLLYFLKSLIDMDYAGREDTDKLSNEVFRNLESVDRACLSEPVKFENRFVAVGTTTSLRRHLDYGSFLKYKDLRVLDLGNVQLKRSADTSDLVKIAELVHLKYLAVRVRTIEIPSAIGNLQNLETFLLSGVGEVKLPESIWKLVSLRHLIMDHSFFSFQNYSREFFENTSQLHNLKSISTLSVRHGSVEKFLRRIPNIQKLGCIFLYSWHDYYEDCNLFGPLEFLSELRSLKMSFSTMAPNPFKFSFPSNLKKLTISNARLPWDQISVIGQLHNLEVLKLLNRAFEGQQWDMRDGEFQKLKFLKLESLDIITWNAFSEHLPCLEQLLLVSCQRLDEIPSCFGELPTLLLIEMKWCSASATDSVKQIVEDQRDLSNDQLKIIVVG